MFECTQDKVDGGRGTELVTHHWGARVDGWFASVDETIGTEPDVVQDRSRQGHPAGVLHVHRVLRMLGAHWRTCLSIFAVTLQVTAASRMSACCASGHLRSMDTPPTTPKAATPCGVRSKRSVRASAESEPITHLHASLVHIAARRKGYVPSTVHGLLSGWPALLWAMAVHHHSLQDAH